MIGIIIVKGIINPISEPSTIYVGNTFGLGFFGGYQTMDALGALIFGGIMLNTFKEKGYTKPLKIR
jgi:branched-chain amino acid:cation transporter, LIVCS family